MSRSIREIVAERLRGFEYRQEARNAARSARTRSNRAAAMMRENGTLKGARQYLRYKGVDFTETVDPVNGHVLLTVPGQVVLAYGADGKYLGSGPVRPRR
jgi:hypothetical protein